MVGLKCFKRIVFFFWHYWPSIVDLLLIYLKPFEGLLLAFLVVPFSLDPHSFFAEGFLYDKNRSNSTFFFKVRLST